MLSISEAYQDRSIRFIDLWEFNGWRIKAYGIAYRKQMPCPGLIATAREVAQERLAQSQDGVHFGVGFAGVHQGRTENFVFIDWWADENELHHHVYVSTEDHPEVLEYKTPSGLIACVWDLQLICFERQAWIDEVLRNPNRPDIDSYLARRLEITP